jgi:hypothetical protein
MVHVRRQGISRRFREGGLRNLVRSIPALGWFLGCGLVAALIVRVRGSDVLVHLGILSAVCVLLAVGTWVERLAFHFDDCGAPPALAHRIVLGQIALVVYFYVRSALSHALHIPGVAAWELYALGAAAGLHLLLRRPRSPCKPSAAYVPVWLVWWGSTFTFLGYRSGRLEPPSSDPDMHTLWAKLTAQHGFVIHDLLPQNGSPVLYPSAFSVLNALWIDLTGASPVAIVNCQIALQACLAVALVLEVLSAVRRGPAVASSLLLLALAHWVFSFPVNEMMVFFEGTPRLAHKATALVPLTLAVRTSRRDPSMALAGREALLVGGFCLAWAPVINPSHLFVELPIVLGAAFALLPHLRSADGSKTTRQSLATWAGICAMAALLMLSDAWLSAAIFKAGPRAGSNHSVALHWAAALSAGLSSAGEVTLVGVLPSRCLPSAQCPAYIATAAAWFVAPLLACAVAVLATAAWRSIAQEALLQAARAVAATAVALLATAFLAGFVPALFSDLPGLQGSLLRSYSVNGLMFSTALLFFALLASALALAAELVKLGAARGGPLRRAHPDLLAAGALVVVFAIQWVLDRELVAQVSRAYAHNVRGAPLTALGSIQGDDVRLVRKAAHLVPPGEKLLLPGLVKEMNEWETWYFTLGGARAVPLYSDVQFAFFHAGSAGSTDAIAYRDHVCERLDLPWLAARGIIWIYESRSVEDSACIYSWRNARARYFTLEAQEGGASLWRLRTDLLPQAERDPSLGAGPF